MTETTGATDRVGNDEFLLEAENLRVTFRAPGGRKLHAVDEISLGVRPRETVGLVGESGSGKSTVALTLMRAHEPEGGRIIFDGQDITHLNYKELMPVRRRLQMVFQDPYSSLDPRWSIRRVISEPLKAHKFGTRQQINDRRQMRQTACRRSSPVANASGLPLRDLLPFSPVRSSRMSRSRR